MMKVIDNNNGKPDMLLDPISYVVTGTRKPKTDVFEEMEKLGKDACMRKAWLEVRPYCESVANKKMYGLANQYWSGKS